ncbi:RDD family protein [Sediminibacterium sp.]|uniref:RDD family protein n=1 Tax=Sediminibacterium sp. TaxID=1917865 RepID=UPI00271B6BF2|nr:RDD family protein [Sediminibacterium sp.]MDO9000651.1 RDD family protein [Bacteroidota bacterium]MDP3146781.1 RDD family protein [Bacteroidota bacterium]MDP3567275.1 RDD family protein [Sediminibacterium sp.]
MDKIKITTSQNVNLNYTAAGVGPRILAALLDLVFIYSYVAIIATIFTFAIRKKQYSGDYDTSENYNQIMIGILILILLPAFLYNLLCETFLNGQSFGKKIVKIKVIKLDGTQPNFGSYLIRSMFRLIDKPIVALITVAVTKNAQRFGDMVAGTTVILLNKRISLDQTILSKQVSNYKLVYPQISLMSDADANTIKEVLDFGTNQNQPQHIALLAKKIKEKYGITALNQSDADFLNTLLMDYTHYQFEK